MTIAYAIVAAIIAAMVVVQLLADPDPELTDAVRGGYANTAIFGTVVVLVAVLAAGLVVDSLRPDPTLVVWQVRA